MNKANVLALAEVVANAPKRLRPLGLEMGIFTHFCLRLTALADLRNGRNCSMRVLSKQEQSPR